MQKSLQVNSPMEWHTADRLGEATETAVASTTAKVVISTRRFNADGVFRASARWVGIEFHRLT